MVSEDTNHGDTKHGGAKHVVGDLVPWLVSSLTNKKVLDF